jgi:Flp pilus assembly protein TadG
VTVYRKYHGGNDGRTICFAPTDRISRRLAKAGAGLSTIARDGSGASALEFALILPVLLTMLFAIVKFVFVINNNIEMTSGTRAGARVLAISRGSATPYTDSVAAFNSSAPNISATVAMSVNGSACSANGTCATLLTSAAGQPVSVSATFPCDLRIGGFNFIPSCNLSAQTTERVE